MSDDDTTAQRATRATRVAMRLKTDDRKNRFVLDVPAIKVAMKDVGEKIRRIKKGHQRVSSVVRERCETCGCAWNGRRVVQPGRNYTTEETQELAYLKLRATALYTIRANGRGRQHVQAHVPHYMRHCSFALILQLTWIAFMKVKEKPAKKPAAQGEGEKQKVGGAP